MRKVVIGFSKPKSKFPVGSWLIRLYQGTSFSHTYLKFYSRSLDRLLVYESVGKVGVRFIGNKRWETHAIEVESFTITLKTLNNVKLMQECVDNEGEDYGFCQNIGVVIADILNLQKNPFKKGKNCSELISEILQDEGYTLPKEPNLMTPKDVYDLLKVNNG
jgi:hypothetical protein